MKGVTTIAQLRNRVILLTPSHSDDGYGGRKNEWREYETVWASVETKTGTERWKDSQAQVNWDVKVIIRYNANIKTDWKVKYVDRTMDVVSLKNVPEDRQFFTEIYCLEKTPE